MSRKYRGGSMPSSAKKTSDMAVSKCCPVWTRISSNSPDCRSCRERGNAFTNCGLAPTMETSRTGSSARPRPDSLTTAVLLIRSRTQLYVRCHSGAKPTPLLRDPQPSEFGKAFVVARVGANDIAREHRACQFEDGGKE